MVKPSANATATPATFDWQSCVDAFNDKDVLKLVFGRRYSRGFCAWLKENGFIGNYRDGFAFPVHDPAGNVVACHYRAKDGKDWFYFPNGTRTRPFVVGKLQPGDVVHVFESYWDAFAFMDKSGERHGIIVTRGAQNGKLVAGLIPTGATVYAWKQNDEVNLQTGKQAGDEWLKDVRNKGGLNVLCPEILAQYKDLNDWTRAGATADELLAAMVEASRGAEQQAKEAASKLAATLDSICVFLRNYIVFQMPEQAWAIALWIVHCWVLDAFDFTPYLHIRSPERQCGKTRLLDCLALLVPLVWRAILPSEAVLFRKIEKDRPTLLLDEIDGIFSDNGKDERREALRSLLNAGFERGAQVPRCVGQGANQEVRNFAVFCPKALAGIGKLPDTVGDRAVPIQLVRRSRDEKVERFRKREAEKEASIIRAGLEAWSKLPGVIEKLREARPSLPDALSDRQQDICEPLLTVADMAAGDWRDKARTALVKLCSDSADQTESLGVTLLLEIRRVFSECEADKLATHELLQALIELETDAPWASWWERDLKDGNTRGPAQKLARLLKPYKICARGIRLPDGNTPRGYLRQDFEESWRRYCPRTLRKT